MVKSKIIDSKNSNSNLNSCNFAVQKVSQFILIKKLDFAKYLIANTMYEVNCEGTVSRLAENI